MRLLSLILLLFTSAALWAQPKFNAPYSKYGIGELSSPYFANQAAWGGQTAAFHDPYHLNPANPASYAFLKSTALETGMFAKYSQYKSSTAAQNEWSGNLAYLALGFTLRSPINEVLDKVKSPWNFGMGIALTPYSRIGYNVETRDTFPNLDDIQSKFLGNGGLYKLGWTGAAKYKNTAFGLGLGWLFGKASYENNTLFYDTTANTLPTFQDNYRQDIAAHGFVWNLGVQHDFVLKYAKTDKTLPDSWITLGLAGNGKYNLQAIADQLQVRSRGKLANGNFYDADTLTNVSDVKQKLVLPSAFTIGIQYVKANKLKVGAQIGFDNWSGYENEARPETLTNTVSFSGGVEYIPEFGSYNKPLKRFRYRAGAYYRPGPRAIGGSDVNELGLTMGVGLPVILARQQTSFVNFSLEIGKVGKNTSIEETYFRLTAGFTLNDNTWFFHRRFE